MGFSNFDFSWCESESKFFGGPMEIVKFVSFVDRLGLILAFCGQLKLCTLMLMGMAGYETYD